jgi:ubiquinone/menaquinone biosynthesis C-methylase UbiE
VDIFEFNVGIDISSKSLLKAKEKLFYRRNQVNFIRADVENLPFRSCVFNIVTTYSLLHHLPNLRKFIYEVNRILVLGGYFIAFHEPNIYELRKVYEKGPIFKFLNLLYYKFCLRYFMKRYKGAFLRHLLEKAIRFKNLGNLEELADIHAKKGFSKEAVERLFLEAGFSKVKIKQRVQDFMWVFSRFSYPLKLLSCIDFIFPIILTFYKKFLPLIMIEAKK